MKKSDYSTVILLYDGKSAAETVSMKKWCQESRFATYEAMNVFQAAEEICDFTVRNHCELVLLKIRSLNKDFPLIKNIMQNLIGGCEIPIMALGSSEENFDSTDCFTGNLDELKTKLDTLMPKLAYSKTA